MKKYLVLTCMALLSIGNALAEHHIIEGRVVGVYDGDTLHILTQEPCDKNTSASKCEHNKTTYRVRMAQIDAPEHNQPYGKKAKQALSDLVFNKLVRIEVQTTDRYGRLVVEVYVNDIWVNRELVRQGAAWVYKKYANSPELFTLEEQAQQQKKGLWALPEKDRVAPWEWRLNRKGQ